jgi:hypothetical protein
MRGARLGVPKVVRAGFDTIYEPTFELNARLRLRVDCSHRANEAPTLDIIGMAAENTEDCKNAAMTGSHRHTIFVDIDFYDPTPKVPTPIAQLNRSP